MKEYRGFLAPQFDDVRSLLMSGCDPLQVAKKLYKDGLRHPEMPDNPHESTHTVFLVNAVRHIHRTWV